MTDEDLERLAVEFLMAQHPCDEDEAIASWGARSPKEKRGGLAGIAAIVTEVEKMQKRDANEMCTTCGGEGKIDERLGGEPNSSTVACPDCETPTPTDEAALLDEAAQLLSANDGIPIESARRWLNICLYERRVQALRVASRAREIHADQRVKLEAEITDLKRRETMWTQAQYMHLRTIEGQAREIERLGAKSDTEMERTKACEHIAEGMLGWEVLRNLCPSTAAAAALRDAYISASLPTEPAPGMERVRIPVHQTTNGAWYVNCNAYVDQIGEILPLIATIIADIPLPADPVTVVGRAE